MCVDKNRFKIAKKKEKRIALIAGVVVVVDVVVADTIRSSLNPAKRTAADIQINRFNQFEMRVISFPFLAVRSIKTK